ncbi:hypothetical protein E9549_10520 [Blastococcus sp. MG754426]|uniref:hypothetical protein n=1 Tax=unclassified Blastococcus TaxID=2619396 RepID=UPI001EF07755|nr:MULTISPECIES: hypothetical protein [unclassified Blastococcus]MCF6507833.1 hypothetical protein [Blastococcus sp. MG754426]MCF6512373.1 hypothetical protein [Blastococcus sp. MG754427]MCF6735413.1 hypothetical protein [Blastococcus sp. KM273129]
MRLRPRPVAAVLAGLVAVLLGGGAAWALLGPTGAGERAVPTPIEVPARELPLGPSAPDPAREPVPAPAPAPDPAPAPLEPRPPAPDPGAGVVPPPPLPDDDDDGDDDGDDDDGDDDGDDDDD